MPARPLVRLPVPPGRSGVTAVLAALPSALDGTGPAVAPVPVASMTVSATYVSRVLAAVRPDDPEHPLERDDVAVVLATSGSTGDPRGVLLPAAALRASADAALDRLAGHGRGEESPAATWLAALPVTSAGGLQVLVRSVVAGSDPVVLGSVGGAAPFDPGEFAAAALETRRRAGSGPAYVSLVPAQLRRLLGEPAAVEGLHALDAVVLGGAAAARSMLDAARDLGVSVTTTYGMTETGGGCVYDGRPLDGVGVRIGSGDEIELTGPTLAAGYRLRPADTAARFVDGWYRTGDLGRLDDGRLRVAGRLDDVVQVRGVNVGVGAVEQVLADAPDVDAVAVVAVAAPDGGARLVAFAVPRPDGLLDDDVRARLAERVREELGGPAVPRDLRAVASLPLLPNGKIDREALRSAAARG